MVRDHYVLARERESKGKFQFVNYGKKVNTGPLDFGRIEALAMDEGDSLKAKSLLEERGYEVDICIYQKRGDVSFKGGPVIDLGMIGIEELLPEMMASKNEI